MKKAPAAKKEYRPPVVTIMGHVDHGKTTLLDAIRNTSVVKTESGGITQHIGAYTVEKDGKKITFIDTPGHEAFSAMRSRGGSVADIIILVVAANDGVMPQTKEAIMHAKASGCPIIVAINKIDLPGSEVNRVKKQLAENDILVEGYGGDIVAVEVSALKGTNLDKLLEVINLLYELDQDKYEIDNNAPLKGVIIESKKDPRKGVLVSIIVKQGILRLGNELEVGPISGKVRSLATWNKANVKEVYPGEAAEILGISDVPSVGQFIFRKGEEHEAQTTSTNSDHITNSQSDVSKQLNLVIRADTYGTQEAIVSSLSKLHLEDASVNVLLAGTGPVKESDILLASSSKAIVIAFKVNVGGSIEQLAESNKVIIREHEIIYKLIEEVEGALEGVLEIEEAKIKGRGLIIETFKLPKSGDLIAGTLVEIGQFKVNQRIGIFRGSSETPVVVTRIKSIHIGRNEVESAKKGEECGLLFKHDITDIQLDDRVEAI